VLDRQSESDYDATAPIRVAVVEDESVMLRAFSIGIAVGIECAVGVSAVEDLPAEVRRTCDVIVLDLQLRGPAVQRDIAHGTRAVVEVGKFGLPVLIYTSESRPEVLAACLALGAVGLVLKQESIDVLAAAIRAVDAGQIFISPVPAGLLTRLKALPTFGLQLTDRQIEILRMRAIGKSRTKIGEQLNISVKTVESHLRNIGLVYGQYMRDHGEAGLLRNLGIGDGDLVDPELVPRRRRARFKR